MSYVRRIGNWEVEVSLTESKVFISDMDGKLLSEFENDDHLGLIEWIYENKEV